MVVAETATKLPYNNTREYRNSKNQIAGDSIHTQDLEITDVLMFEEPNLSCKTQHKDNSTNAILASFTVLLLAMYAY
jgi:poly-beta-hydroxyalkanoate depolymerase